jgi:hypothetical protein
MLSLSNVIVLPCQIGPSDNEQDHPQDHPMVEVSRAPRSTFDPRRRVLRMISTRHKPPSYQSSMTTQCSSSCLLVPLHQPTKWGVCGSQAKCTTSPGVPSTKGLSPVMMVYVPCSSITKIELIIFFAMVCTLCVNGLPSTISPR